MLHSNTGTPLSPPLLCMMHKSPQTSAIAFSTTQWQHAWCSCSKLVWVAGFEPTAFRIQNGSSTRLSYTQLFLSLFPHKLFKFFSGSWWKIQSVSIAITIH